MTNLLTLLLITIVYAITYKIFRIFNDGRKKEEKLSIFEGKIKYYDDGSFYSPNFLLQVEFSDDEDADKKTRYKKTYIDSAGYRCFIDTGKYVHRWVVEKNIGRRLKKYEVIHHKDGNKLNNHIKNLYLCSREEHDQIHRNNLYNYGTWHTPQYLFKYSK